MNNGKYITTEEGETAIYGYSCIHNEGVGCHVTKHNCETCGWNPEVAQKRLEEYCRKNHIPYPLPVIQKEEEIDG